MEQNKYTGSPYARMAKGGAEIVQIIYSPPRKRGQPYTKGKYLAWFDGEVLTKYRPAAPGGSTN